MPILRKSGFQSISPPTPQISRPLAARRGPGDQVVLDGLLQPDVDVEQAAAAARRRVAAFQREPRVRRRQQRDVFDGILDVEVFQRGDVEIRRVEVRLDQPRHDRAAARVDAHRRRAATAGSPPPARRRRCGPSRITTAPSGTGGAPVPSISCPFVITVVPGAVCMGLLLVFLRKNPERIVDDLSATGTICMVHAALQEFLSPDSRIRSLVVFSRLDG